LSSRTIQYLIGSVFFVLGGWCLVALGMVVELCIQPAYRSDTFLVNFSVACFGAQAMISGLFASFSRFTKTTFIAYGLGLLPFFAFNYWFYFVEPVLTPVGLLDFAGNIIMLILCVMGWRKVEA
jgi:hypothetical protein